MTPLPLALLVGALLTSLYAAALATPLGREITAAKTWITVVVGVTLVLASLALFWWQAALAAFGFFAVAGLPILVWQQVEEFNERRRVTRLHMEE